MSNWVLLHGGESVPQMEPNSMVHLALQKGAIIRVMYRFVKNIKNPIAGYLIEGHDLRPDMPAELRVAPASPLAKRVEAMRAEAAKRKGAANLG